MSGLAGTATMVRLVLRRDRVRLPVWVLSIAVLLVSSVLSVAAFYDDPVDQQAYAAAVGGNAAAVVMGGPGIGLPGLGGIVVFEVSVVGYVAVALMSLMLVTRHTRAEEEAGRTELLRAGVVGRYAGVVAALAVVGGANLVVGAALAVGCVAAGLPVAGSVALGAGVAAFGLVMAAVAAVAAQVTAHARGASGIAAAALGLFFVLRAAGDVGNGTLSAFSPMGWAHRLRPFAGEQWALLVPLLVFTALAAAAAFVLLDRRDLGGSLVAARPGRAEASRWLAGPVGLAVRQHRAAFAGWAAGMLSLGLAYGSVGESVQQLVQDNEAIAEFIAAGGADLVDSYFVVTGLVIALIGSGFAVQVVTRMRSEEAAGRLEPLLATALPRWRWAASHLLVAVAGVTVLLLLAGLALGATHASLTGDPGQVWRLAAVPLAYAPATWTLVGLGVLALGVVPRAVGVAWVALAASALVLLMAQPLRLPDWLVDATPFAWVPSLPVEAFVVAPLAVLALVSAAGVGAGVAGLRARDVG